MEDEVSVSVIVTYAVTAGGYVLSALFVPRVLLRRHEPGATLSWIFVILLLPYLGPLFYTMFGDNRIKRRSADKNRSDTRIEEKIAPLVEAQRQSAPAPFKGVDDPILRVSRRLNLPDPIGGNAVEVYTEGPAAFGAVLDAIGNARHSIHLEFFVFRSDSTGKRVMNALVAACRRGVEVRLLVDSVGRWMGSTLPGFFRPLEKAGGRFAKFLPVGPVRGYSVFNLRNHRKLVIVDGQAAFTGGMNVGDEYSGIGGRGEQAWRDLWVQVQGPATGQMQELFARDWFFATDEAITAPAYFPAPENLGEDFVQLVASGPDNSLLRLHRLIIALIQSAQERLYITTPYFVPDPALASAIEQAALRGVEVRLLLPMKSNHPLTQWAGLSFYEELFEAGVVIHEFERGMLHAKAIVVDGKLASVGSANMDIRSFRLNFEANLFIYGPDFAGQIEETFVQDTLASRRVVPEQWAKRRLHTRIFETAARVLSPVL